MTATELDNLINQIKTETRPQGNTKERIAQALKGVKDYAEMTSVFAKNSFVFTKNLWRGEILHQTWAGSPSLTSETFNGFPIYKCTREWQGWNITQQITQPVVLSFWARNVNHDASKVRVLLNNGSHRIDRNIPIGREFQRFVFKYELGITPNSHGTFGISSHKEGTEYACIQLEYGNEATFYMPNFEFLRNTNQIFNLPSKRITEVPQNGNLEFDGRNLYFTINGRRKRVQLVD